MRIKVLKPEGGFTISKCTLTGSVVACLVTLFHGIMLHLEFTIWRISLVFANEINQYHNEDQSKEEDEEYRDFICW